MKKEKKVSVIVPIFNMEKYLGACLDSLINQTLSEIEIVCVNDGSTDKSLEIVKKYKKRDGRIKIVNQENGGLSSARNAGLKKVSAPYVMFCDPDDQFDLKMCEKMYSAIEDSGADLAICGIKMIYEAHQEMQISDENYYRLRFDGKKIINDKVIMETNGSACNKIFRMSIIKENDIDFPEGLTSEDHCFYCKYMSVSKTIYFLSQKLYHYVRREESIMSNNFDGNKLAVDDIKVAEKIFRFYKKNGFLDTHKNLFWTQWTGGFWASYRYSGKKYRKEVIALGKDFINKNYEEYKPQDRRVQKIVEEVAKYNFLYRLKMFVRNAMKGCYLKINYAFKQQNFINMHLEGAYERFRYISECLDSLTRGEK